VSIIAVDGGASKTSFVLTDESGHRQQEIVLERGSNPNYVGLAETLNVLEKGFSSLCKNSEQGTVRCIYMGLAGCFRSSFHSEITYLARKYSDNVELGGDLYSSYRSLALGVPGILAVAGTSTAIATFLEDGSVHFNSSIAYGGRDFGELVLGHISLGDLDQNSSIYQTLKAGLLDFEALLERTVASKQLNDTAVNSISRLLAQASVENEKLLQELKPYLLTCAIRVIQKLATAAMRHELVKSPQFELVLSGSFWKWDYMRSLVEQELKRYFPQVRVLYSAEICPLEGCITIALEQLHA